jgi:hypothetical protein
MHGKRLAQEDKEKGNNNRQTPVRYCCRHFYIGTMNGAVLVSQYLETRKNWQDAIEQLQQ